MGAESGGTAERSTRRIENAQAWRATLRKKDHGTIASIFRSTWQSSPPAFRGATDTSPPQSYGVASSSARSVLGRATWPDFPANRGEQPAKFTKPGHGATSYESGYSPETQEKTYTGPPSTRATEKKAKDSRKTFGFKKNRRGHAAFGGRTPTRYLPG